MWVKAARKVLSIETIEHATFYTLNFYPCELPIRFAGGYHTEKIAEADAVRERVELGKGKPSR